MPRDGNRVNADKPDRVPKSSELFEEFLDFLGELRRPIAPTLPK